MDSFRFIRIIGLHFIVAINCNGDWMQKINSICQWCWIRFKQYKTSKEYQSGLCPSFLLNSILRHARHSSSANIAGLMSHYWNRQLMTKFSIRNFFQYYFEDSLVEQPVVFYFLCQNRILVFDWLSVSYSTSIFFCWSRSLAAKCSSKWMESYDWRKNFVMVNNNKPLAK